MDRGFLYELLKAGGVSGNEFAVEKIVFDHMKDKADSVTVDELGNVTAALNTSASFKVLLTGHADEIGLMVTAVTDDGMLKVNGIGHVFPSIFLGHKVRIYTERGIVYGAVVNTKDLREKKELEESELTIDIGASGKNEALSAVSPGDTLTFDTDVRELLGARITARALDDRTGVFIVMEALKKAAESGVSIGVYSAATTGEETTMNGAYFTASRIKPNIAIAVDVTYTSDYEGTNIADTGDIGLGRGPVICNNPSIHKKVNVLLKKAAEKAGIKIQIEAANGRTGTDGDVMHRTGIGVPFALVSIPLRYMHSPAECADLNDIENCIDLLAEFLCSLSEDTDLKPF
ncbi:MAG: M20/M25/M40 family metallo-hydrolase [Clostridia bacterium]|nr:M20/M25/M40 family metallo-hydrolase [Clostridia bacterium]